MVGMVLFFIPWEPPPYITTIENIVRWGEGGGKVYLIANYTMLLQHETLSVGGISLFCQPKRGTSLQNFMTMVDTVNTSTDALLSSEEEEGPFFK